MWFSEHAEFFVGGHSILCTLLAYQQVTSDPGLDRQAYLHPIREPYASAKHVTRPTETKIIFVMSELLRIDDIYYCQRLCQNLLSILFLRTVWTSDQICQPSQLSAVHVAVQPRDNYIHNVSLILYRLKHRGKLSKSVFGVGIICLPPSSIQNLIQL